MKLQYYQNNIKNSKPAGSVDLFALLDRIRQPKNEAIYDQIKQAELNGDNETKAKLKTQLYFFVPATISNGESRSYKNITAFTGLLALDFDHIENADEFRDLLFKEYQYIIAAWLSASGRGVKALVSIPICNSVDEYKAYFWGVYNELAIYEGFDTAPQNAVLPLFMSYDKDIKVRKDFTTFATKGKHPNESFNETIQYKYDPKFSDGFKLWIVKETENRITSITTNGHPQLRAWAYYLGGLVGGGYIEKSEAESALFYSVRASRYLSKGVEGYLKTAQQMINKGINEPVIIQNK